MELASDFGKIASLSLINEWRRDLSAPARAAFDRRQTTRTFSAGEFLFRVGDPATSCYQVVSGHVTVRSFSREGRQMILSSHGKGACLGEQGLVTESARLNDLVADTRTVVNVLHRRDFEAAAEEFPEILVALNRLLGARFEFLFALIQDANLLPLYDRLGRVIVRLALERSGGRLACGQTVRLEALSQEGLAEMLGAVRQSVGRELKKMEEQKLLRTEYRGLTILDLGRMSRDFSRSLAFEPMTESRLQTLFDDHVLRVNSAT